MSPTSCQLLHPAIYLRYVIIAFASCTKDEVAMTGDIHGLVTDADNGEPVKSANVSFWVKL